MLTAYNTLRSEFGIKPVAFVVLLEVGARGVVFTGIASVLLPFYREELLVRESAEFQKYSAISSLAWSLGKPVVGLLADSFPLWGYHKRWYMVLFAVLGSLMLLISALLPKPSSQQEAAPLKVVFTITSFIATICVVAIDLLVEGTYSAMIRRKTHSGSLLLSVAYGAATFGNISVSLLVGMLADAHYYRLILLLLVPCCLACAIPPALNWSRESFSGVGPDRNLPPPSDALEPTEAEIHTLSRSTETGIPAAVELPAATYRAVPECAFLSPYLGGTLANHPQLAAMAIAVGSLAALVGLTITFADPIAALTMTLASGVILVLLALRWLDRIVAFGVISITLMNTTYISIPAALDYFYLADDSCVPGGPHFDYTYYESFTAVISAAAAALGLMIFQRFLVQRTYGSVSIMTSVAQGIASMFDVLIVTRMNKTVLGLPDKATYFFGDAIVGPACAMMNFMPCVVLISRLCPKGVEAVMYSLLAGMMNFGQTTSQIIGQQAIIVAGIRTSVPCNFENLPLLILVTHLLLPGAFFPVVYWLMPRRRMNEKIYSDDPDNTPTGDDQEMSNIGEQQVTSVVESLS